jgi:hypothetical protein
MEIGCLDGKLGRMWGEEHTLLEGEFFAPFLFDFPLF